jgi:hypothetical protein
VAGESAPSNARNFAQADAHALERRMHHEWGAVEITRKAQQVISRRSAYHSAASKLLRKPRSLETSVTLVNRSNPMSANVNVLCIKWGTKYGPEYVDTLQRMVARHLSRPHRFVCMTDDAAGIDGASVEVLPIPKVGFDEFDERKPWTFGHGWLKLTSFANPLHDLRGPTLFLDLDIVIVDALDPFFDVPGEFVVIREWDKHDGTGNTSCYRYTAGAHPDALEYLKRDYPRNVQAVRNEQEFITGYLGRQGKVSFWPDAWCRSFKRHCVPRGVRGWFEAPRIPEGARIVAFHGKPNPPDAIAGRSGRWYRRVLPTPWVAEHWR